MKSSKIKEYEAMSVEDLRKEEKALKSGGKLWKEI